MQPTSPDEYAAIFKVLGLEPTDPELGHPRYTDGRYTATAMLLPHGLEVRVAACATDDEGPWEVRFSGSLPIHKLTAAAMKLLEDD